MGKDKEFGRNTVLRLDVRRPGASRRRIAGCKRAKAEARARIPYEIPILEKRDESREGDFWCD